MENQTEFQKLSVEFNAIMANAPSVDGLVRVEKIVDDAFNCPVDKKIYETPLSKMMIDFNNYEFEIKKSGCHGRVR
jgi:hypothetical protein